MLILIFPLTWKSFDKVSHASLDEVAVYTWKNGIRRDILKDVQSTMVFDDL